MDLFTRKIVGWKVADHMQESIVLEAIKQVIQAEQPFEGLIVHSDGGGQYAAKKFRALLKRQKFVQSMTRKDNHYDNAYAEIDYLLFSNSNGVGVYSNGVLILNFVSNLANTLTFSEQGGRLAVSLNSGFENQPVRILYQAYISECSSARAIDIVQVEGQKKCLPANFQIQARNE